MQPKKHPRADLEKKRSFFFLAGLLIALLSVIGIIQIQKEVSIPEPPGPKVYDGGITIPITKPETKEEARPKKLTKKKPEITDVFKPVEKLPVDHPEETFNLPEEKPVEIEIGQEEVGEELDPVEIVFLEHIAAPATCPVEAPKEEKMACLNDWIMRYVQENAVYPEKARRLGLRDKVYVSFVIAENGEIEQVETLRGEYDILNEEAERVLRNMPRWNPARQFTRNVKMRMTVPVNFRQQ